MPQCTKTSAISTPKSHCQYNSFAVYDVHKSGSSEHGQWRLLFHFFFLQVSLVIRAVELRYRCCIEMVTNFVYILLSWQLLLLLPIIKIMIMIISETSGLYGCWFCEIKLLCEIKSICNRKLFPWFNYYFFQFCCIVNYNSILNIFIEVVLAISSKIYTNYKLISHTMLIFSIFPQDWFREINKTDFAKSTGVNNFLN